MEHYIENDCNVFDYSVKNSEIVINSSVVEHSCIINLLCDYTLCFLIC